MSESASTPDRILRRLEWTVIRRLDGLLHGDYRTLFRGAGLDLADLREYQYHDDVRHIDWNVTARMTVPHVRVYVPERALTAWLLLDVSPSMTFGTADRRKADVAEGVALAIGHLATQRGNRLGVLTFGGGPVGRRKRCDLPLLALQCSTGFEPIANFRGDPFSFDMRRTHNQRRLILGDSREIIGGDPLEPLITVNFNHSPDAVERVYSGTKAGCAVARQAVDERLRAVERLYLDELMQTATVDVAARPSNATD
jgi:hypothetical protein